MTDHWPHPALLRDQVRDPAPAGAHDGHSVDELVGVVSGEDDGTVGRDVPQPHDLDAREEDGQDGVEEGLDAEVHQIGEAGEEHVQGQDAAQGGDVPGGEHREDVQ